MPEAAHILKRVIDEMKRRLKSVAFFEEARMTCITAAVRYIGKENHEEFA